MRCSGPSDHTSLLQAAMVAKLDTKAEQAAANGLLVDDEQFDSGASDEEPPSSAKKHSENVACIPDLGRTQPRSGQRGSSKLCGSLHASCLAARHCTHHSRYR